MSIQTKKEIITGLTTQFDAFMQTIATFPEAHFEDMPNGKWSAGQNLHHLISSVNPLHLAFAMPKFILKWQFGKPNREPRTYEALVERYQEKLANGGTAPIAFEPPVIPLLQREKLLKNYLNHKNRLVSSVEKWSEHDLDNYLLPHPLLGKLTLREMLFFTIYHNEHHRKAVDKIAKS